jgi:hypothetical protein
MLFAGGLGFAKRKRCRQVTGAEMAGFPLGLFFVKRCWQGLEFYASLRQKLLTDGAGGSEYDHGGGLTRFLSGGGVEKRLSTVFT